MILRALALAGGVMGGVLASQFPEFSQQYAQRLGGAVDALAQVVQDFDASAEAEGLSREDALTQMVGTDFIERRQADMRRTFARHTRLSEDLAALETAGPFQRAAQIHRFTDREVARATWDVFRPALPLTLAGGVFAGLGAIAGLLTTSGVTRLLMLPFGLRRRRA